MEVMMTRRKPSAKVQAMMELILLALAEQDRLSFFSADGRVNGLIRTTLGLRSTAVMSGLVSTAMHELIWHDARIDYRAVGSRTYGLCLRGALSDDEVEQLKAARDTNRAIVGAPPLP